MAERHWSERGHEQGIFAAMLAGLAADHGEKKTVMIPLIERCALNCRAMDATYLKAHRTATSLGVKFGGSENDPVDRFPDGRGAAA